MRFMMKTKRAFTLVEVLVVIAIIGILATLVTVAVAGAMRAGKRAAISAVMHQISMSLDHYKAEFGEYPPDMFDDEALVRHIKKRFPRLDWANLPPGVSDADRIRTAISNAYGNGVDFTHSNSRIGSLVLWLGGFPNSDGKFSGFFADPEHPFTPTLDGAFDKKNFADLELGNNVRFENIDGCIVPVFGNEVQSVFVPFVYFRGKEGGGSDAYTFMDSSDGFMKIKQVGYTDIGVCVPYADEKINADTTKWKNPATYQLIHPGLDGKFGDGGPERIIKSRANIGVQDLDNITNISDCKELKSILP